MSGVDSLPGPERLLAHGRFVRALLRDLVGDPHTVDDVLQQTWTTALEKRPADASKQRSWLASVARHLAANWRRSDRHRRAREARAAAPEAVPSALALAEQREILRLVVDAVLELPERHQTVVLMRFYQDLPPRDIARALGVPVETVKSRLQRALGELRERLDRRANGREAWVSAALVLRLPDAPPAAASALLLWKGGAAVLAVGLVSAVTLLVWPRGSRSDADPDTPASERSTRDPGRGAAAGLPRARRDEVAASDGSPPPESTTAIGVEGAGPPQRYRLVAAAMSDRDLVLRLDTTTGSVWRAEGRAWAPFAAAPSDEAAGAPGKFAIMVAPGATDSAVLLIDTATGTTWRHDGASWVPFDPPR